MHGSGGGSGSRLAIPFRRLLWRVEVAWGPNVDRLVVASSALRAGGSGGCVSSSGLQYLNSVINKLNGMHAEVRKDVSKTLQIIYRG